MPTETKTKQRIIASKLQQRVQLVVRSVWIVWQAVVALIWCWVLCQNLVWGLFCTQAAMAGIAWTFFLNDASLGWMSNKSGFKTNSVVLQTSQ